MKTVEEVNKRITELISIKFIMCYKKSCPIEIIKGCLTEIIRKYEEHTGLYIVKNNKKAVGIGDIEVMEFLNSERAILKLDFIWEELEVKLDKELWEDLQG